VTPPTVSDKSNMEVPVEQMAVAKSTADPKVVVYDTVAHVRDKKDVVEDAVAPSTNVDITSIGNENYPDASTVELDNVNEGTDVAGGDVPHANDSIDYDHGSGGGHDSIDCDHGSGGDQRPVTEVRRKRPSRPMQQDKDKKTKRK
jgi:hypothetical protein